MNDTITPVVLLLVVVWPLLLAAAVAFAATRHAALRLASWAALPALATGAACTETELRLTGILLDSGLVLDSIGRTFLLLSAGVWLATGLLARPQLSNSGTSRVAILLLLAMAGGFGMALAADALLFFAASTLAAYALYGLLVHGADAASIKAGRVLVVLLVLSDLVVFELLLLLSQSAGNVDFPSLRQAFANTDSRGLVLGLLIAGFGVKAGVIGFHYWLPPVFISAAPALRPALIGFISGAGLLGWLRLLPIGEVHWSTAGTVLQWLAWVTLAYAVVAGTTQAHFRSVLAYAVTALTGLWLAMLGFALLYPQTGYAVVDASHAVVLQGGFAVAALLLLERKAGGGLPLVSAALLTGLRWLAALILAAAPANLASLTARFDNMAAMQVSWATAAIAFLVVRRFLQADSAEDGAAKSTSPMPPRRQAIQVPATLVLPVAGALTAAAAVAAAYNIGALPLAELWRPALPVVAAALAAWLSHAWLASRMPTLPPGDLLVPVGNRVVAALGHGKRLASVRLPLWRDAWLAFALRAWNRTNFWQLLERVEFALNRWRNVLVILLLLSVIVAWLGKPG